MKYLIELDEDTGALELVRRGLGKLPYDEVAQLISNIGMQMGAQEKAARLPPVPEPPGAPAADPQT